MSDGRSEESMTKDQIKHMVDRFLGWRLPENFSPDDGVSFERFGNRGTPYEYRREPSGTNLLDAVQTEAMVRYMVEGMPASDALERAEREHAERLDALAAEITALRGEAERDENDLRAAAASEAAMREVAELAVRPMGLPPITIMGGDTVVLDTANLNKLRAALSAPASALAQRYEAVVKAARNCAHAQQITGSMWSVHRSIEDLAKALSALDHPTPAKDDEA